MKIGVSLGSFDVTIEAVVVNVPLRWQLPYLHCLPAAGFCHRLCGAVSYRD
jgi:hypothetical protein